jgi:ribonuclease HI
MLKIFCDGGSRGNPGKAASAFVAENNNKKIFSNSIYLGETTNNVAEYEAVILALKWLADNSSKFNFDDSINFVLDSELVVRQINGIYKVKNDELKKRIIVVKNLQNKINKKIIFQHVSRELNTKADTLVNKQLDVAL